MGAPAAGTPHCHPRKEGSKGRKAALSSLTYFLPARRERRRVDEHQPRRIALDEESGVVGRRAVERPHTDFARRRIALVVSVASWWFARTLLGRAHRICSPPSDVREVGGVGRFEQRERHLRGRMRANLVDDAKGGLEIQCGGGKRLPH